MQGKGWKLALLGSICSGILLMLFSFPVLTDFGENGSALAQTTEPMTVREEPDEGGFVNQLKKKSWSPYVAGMGIGILSWLTFLLSDKPIGASSAYVRMSGMIEKALRDDKGVEEKAYYKKHPPTINWEVLFVGGLFIGAFLSAVFSGDFHLSTVPVTWKEKFGNTPFIRVTIAFIGGTIMAIGARWAGGCTSGHGVSGTLQLVVSSWIAVACFFIGGIFTARLIYTLF